MMGLLEKALVAVTSCVIGFGVGLLLVEAFRAIGG